MLSRLFKSLLFPQLVFQKRVTLRNNQDLRMYKLGWTKMEKICQERHERWNKDSWPEHDLKLGLPLPEKYLSICDNLLFVLDDNYRSEITRNSYMALQEWTHRRSFDTNIREYCLNTAKSFVDVAFYLLEDCIYDEKTNYYFRERNYYFNMMLYRFWRYQTGRGLLYHNAKIDKLENLMDDKTNDEIQDFVIEMMKFQDLVCDSEGAPIPDNVEKSIEKESENLSDNKS